MKDVKKGNGRVRMRKERNSVIFFEEFTLEFEFANSSIMNYRKKLVDGIFPCTVDPPH